MSQEGIQLPGPPGIPPQRGVHHELGVAGPDLCQSMGPLQAPVTAEEPPAADLFVHPAVGGFIERDVLPGGQPVPVRTEPETRYAVFTGKADDDLKDREEPMDMVMGVQVREGKASGHEDIYLVAHLFLTCP